MELADVLRSSAWVALRTEIHPWDDDENKAIRGYDGFTRFWCPEAVFDLYWVAELEGDQLTLIATEDMMLTGFRKSLPGAGERQTLQALAEHLNWKSLARAAVVALQRRQFELFEDK